MADRDTEYFSEISGKIGLGISSSLLALTLWRLGVPRRSHVDDYLRIVPDDYDGHGQSSREGGRRRRRTSRKHASRLIFCLALSCESIAYLTRSGIFEFFGNTSLSQRIEIVLLPILGRSMLELSACAAMTDAWLSTGSSRRASLVVKCCNGILLFALAVLSLLLSISVLDRRVEREWRQNFSVRGEGEGDGEQEFLNFLHSSFLGVAHQWLESAAWGLQSILVGCYCLVLAGRQAYFTYAGYACARRTFMVFKESMPLAIVSIGYAFRCLCLIYHAVTSDADPTDHPFFDEDEWSLRHQTRYWIFWAGEYWVPLAFSVIVALFESDGYNPSMLRSSHLYDPLLPFATMPPPGVEIADWRRRFETGGFHSDFVDGSPPVREVIVRRVDQNDLVDEVLSTGS